MKVLKNAGVGTDEPGLVEFFSKHIVSDAQRRNIGELIKQLGDHRFRGFRERATRELKAMAPAALLALQQATHHGDLEVASRAKRCLEALHGPATAGIPAARLTSATQAALRFAAGVRDAPDAGSQAIPLAEGVLQAMLVSKIKIIATVLLLAVVTTAGTG